MCDAVLVHAFAGGGLRVAGLSWELERAGAGHWAGAFPRSRVGQVYLARVRRADIVLDTRVWNGEMTALDVLWEGTPQLTLKGVWRPSPQSFSLALCLLDMVSCAALSGQQMANRFGASAAMGLGLRGCDDEGDPYSGCNSGCTTTQKGYEDAAVALLTAG